MKFFLKIIACFYPAIIFSQTSNIEKTKTISLNQAIEIALDASLSIHKAQNSYLSGYWQFRMFKAERLPSLSISATPFSYNQNFVERYDYQNNVVVYKSQQSLYSQTNLSLKQNLDITGGTFYIDTEMGYFRNLGLNTTEQFSSVPIRIGYSQNIFGFNSFKWSKRIEPISYEKVTKEFLYNIEGVAEQTAELFFELALNKKNFELAKQNIENSDTLYKIGLERFKIGTISQPDLLTLKLQVINSKNNLGNVELDLKKSTFLLTSFLRLDKETQINLSIPKEALNIVLSSEDVIRKAKENNPIIPQLKESTLKAQQDFDKTKKESRFSATFSASVGFNQVASNLSDAYHKPLQQNLVSVGFDVPLLDWGVRKGKIKISRENLNTVKINAVEAEQSFEQDVLMTLAEFNLQQTQIKLSEEAREISEIAYDKAKQLFLVGKSDLNSLNMAYGHRIEAEQNYLIVLKKYWLSYFKLRKLTLYDFVLNKKISVNENTVNSFR